MSETERSRWDGRYRDGAYAQRAHPTAFLAASLHELPRGRALDVACGAGRNAICLAAAGFAVDAVDISAAGLERAALNAQKLKLDINWIEADLGVHPIGSTLPAGNYDLIVMVRYVNATLIDALAKKLNAGGYLLCEQHLRTAHEVVGPRSPEYRLGANELLHAATNLRVLSYREGLVTDPDGRRAALAQLIACREPALFDTAAVELP
jgi:SAM-dependent methyltransferase